MLVPVMLLSALHSVRFMLVNETIPAPIGPMLAFFDLPSVVFIALMFGVGLANVRRLAAHKRYMATTVLPGTPPALTQLFLTLGVPSPVLALHASILVVHVVLLALIVSDWRNGVRERACFAALAFFVVVQLLLVRVGTGAQWGALMERFAAMPWKL